MKYKIKNIILFILFKIGVISNSFAFCHVHEASKKSIEKSAVSAESIKAWEKLITVPSIRKSIPALETVSKWLDGVTGEATSIKSIDLDAKSYQNASKLKSRLNKYAKDLDDFTSYSISNVTIGNAARPVNLKTLEVALPRAASGAQLSAINEVIQTWSSKLTIKITIVT